MNNVTVIITVLLGITLAAAAGLWQVSSGPGLEEAARDLVQKARELPGTSGLSGAAGEVIPEQGWSVLRPWPQDTPLTRAAWSHLPGPAVRYFDRSGVLGKKQVKSFSLVMEGRIRQGPDSPWMDIVMRQYNHMDPPARIVFIRTAEGPMTGVDSLVDGRGRMVIRLFNLLGLTDNTGPEMDVSALVTFLNDLVFCPLGYFALTTEWKELDGGRVLLRFRDRGLIVEAELEITPEGDLRNWKTPHRWAEVGGKNVPDLWETPLTGFGESRGLRIPSAGRGVHNIDGSPYDYFEIAKNPVLVPDASGLPGKTEEQP
jgi:hypothetical protein